MLLPHGPKVALGANGEGGSLGSVIWRAALALVGTPFRFHGSDPAIGLDCVGLVLAAHRAAGVEPVRTIPTYRVRDMDGATAVAFLESAGLVRVADSAAGDVLLCAVGHRQMHLMIAGDGAVVHAHAGLRRVVLMPGDAAGVVGRWRWGGPCEARKPSLPRLISPSAQ